jgi:hypothetical protein
MMMLNENMRFGIDEAALMIERARARDEEVGLQVGAGVQGIDDLD